MPDAPGEAPAGEPAPGSRQRRVLVFGATGLVGGHLVRLLSAEGDVARIVAPVRRAGARVPGVPRVETPVVDFQELAARAAGWSADQAFVCLGTTMKKAGSRDAFRAVDYHAVVNAARAAGEAGAQDVFLVSSVGADPRARGFYLRVKGEADEAVSALPFRSVHIARPSILTGERSESRPAERVGIVLASLGAPFMVGPARRYRPIPAEVVARAMVVLARSPGVGVHVHPSEELARLGTA